MRELLREGHDPTQPDPRGWLPLHHAAANDRARVIAALIAAGAPLEAPAGSGWTPLHLACANGSARAVSALVAAGADVNAPARSGDTPLHLALTIVFDAEYPSLRRRSLRVARDMLGTLLAAGADPRALDGKGRSAADTARARGAPSLARLLEPSA